ncbi:MAG: tetratricopeptide repeat protein, partial [Henriciella sp.]|nr:tetratricopeptide repeat protein [Henriciella sp.]
MPETNEALLETVDRLAHEGQGVEAIAQLKAALARQPRAFSLWLRLSRLHYEAGEFRDALTAMRKAERADPMPEGFTQIQQAIQSRRYEDARAMAEAMLEKVPGHPRAVFTLAHLARARGDHEKAAAQLSDSFS